MTKPITKKMEFVRLRAEGHSHAAIARQLGIAKSTCTEWEKRLYYDVVNAKKEMVHELADAYSATKAARIRSIGETLKRIDAALDAAQLEKVPSDRLLSHKLKYMELLKAETVEERAFERDYAGVKGYDDMLTAIRKANYEAEDEDEDGED